MGEMGGVEGVGFFLIMGGTQRRRRKPNSPSTGPKRGPCPGEPRKCRAEVRPTRSRRLRKARWARTKTATPRETIGLAGSQLGASVSPSLQWSWGAGGGGVVVNDGELMVGFTIEGFNGGVGCRMGSVNGGGEGNYGRGFIEGFIDRCLMIEG